MRPVPARRTSGDPGPSCLVSSGAPRPREGPRRQTARLRPGGPRAAGWRTDPIDVEAPVMRLRMRLIAAAVAASLAVGPAGCATVTRVITPAPVCENPLVVPVADLETVWRET